MNFELPQEGPTPEQPKSDKEAFQEKLQNLLASGAPLQEVAEVLGAEEFLKKEGPKGREGLHLDVKAFTEEQFQEGKSAMELPESFTKLPDTILPPGEGEIRTGSGKGLEQKALIPRTKAFIELLSELKEPYAVVSGTNTEEMMREETYRIFLLSKKGKLFFINDEEGNATFVAHKALPDTWQKYAAMTKEELRELPASEVEAINYPGSLEDWRLRMETALFTTPEELEKIAQERKEEESEKAPEGWVTNKSLARKWQSGEGTISSLVGSFRVVHPEWFRIYQNKAGRLSEYYHPSLIQEVDAILAEKHEAKVPEGWSTKGALRIELDVSEKTITKVIDPLRMLHPEWFQEYFMRGRMYEHYHPDLVRHLKEMFSKRRENRAPEGWYIVGTLARKLSSEFATVERISKKFKDAHPEWFHDYSNSQNKILEYLHPDLVQVVSDILKARSEAPEGWKTNYFLANENGKAEPVIKKIAEKFRASHPEWFFDYANSQGRIFEHYHPDLVSEIQRVLESLPDRAPEGWMTATGLGSLLGKDKTVLIKMAAPFKESHPEWFQEYADRNGVSRVHFHPALVQKIKEEVPTAKENKKSAKENFQEAPEGWSTKKRLENETGMDGKTIAKYVDSYRETNPDWFQFFRTKTISAEHFHPELAQKIREIASARPEKAPSGWMAIGPLAHKLSAAYETVKALSDPFRLSHPEWFNPYRDGSGKATEFLHPELIVAVTEEMSKRHEKAPDGWYTNRKLSDESEVEAKTVIRIVMPFRETHPQWFRILSNEFGHIREHYHPDLVAIVKTELSKREIVPDGWYTIESLRKNLDAPRTLVEKIVEKYKITHPEWIKRYKTEKGFFVEHCHPELCQKVLDEISEIQYAPADWLTAKKLSDEIRRDDGLLRRTAQSFKAEHPEWFEEFMSEKGVPREFYHPELVMALKQIFEKLPPNAPEGWYTRNGVAKEVNFEASSVKNIAESYRNTHPEWFQEYSDKNSILREHYHPHLVEKIKEEVAKRKKA